MNAVNILSEHVNISYQLTQVNGLGQDYLHKLPTIRVVSFVRT